ncbi:MAG: hypothetical protein KBG27_09855 [Flexilinea sp.]|nr:hypothetical protein [Flexilinea sp.]
MSTHKSVVRVKNSYYTSNTGALCRITEIVPIKNKSYGFQPLAGEIAVVGPVRVWDRFENQVPEDGVYELCCVASPLADDEDNYIFRLFPLLNDPQVTSFHEDK